MTEEQLACDRVHEGHTVNLKVFPDYESLHCAHLQAGLGVLHAKDKFAGVLTDFIKEFADEPLLLNKLDIRQGVCRKLNRLIEAVLTACMRDAGRSIADQHAQRFL